MARRRAAQRERTDLLGKILASFQRFRGAYRGMVSDARRPDGSRMERPTNERQARVQVENVALKRLFFQESLLRKRLGHPRLPGVYPMRAEGGLG